jgi:hypothetical protein
MATLNATFCTLALSTFPAKIAKGLIFTMIAEPDGIGVPSEIR